MWAEGEKETTLNAQHFILKDKSETPLNLVDNICHVCLSVLANF